MARQLMSSSLHFTTLSGKQHYYAKTSLDSSLDMITVNLKSSKIKNSDQSIRQNGGNFASTWDLMAFLTGQSPSSMASDNLSSG